MFVTIVGGSGFIGSRLASRLNKSQVAFKIVDKVTSQLFPSETNIANVCDLTNLKTAIGLPDAIINLAAEHRDDVTPISLYDDVNIGGAHNICKSAIDLGVNKIIFTSSVAVYGFALLNTSEHGAIAPINDYGRTKWEAEQIFREWQKGDPLNRTLVIVRPTVVFGESNRGNVFNLLSHIVTGKFVMIGDGLNMKSMAYVENVSAFIEYSLQLKPGIHLYNYVDKPDLTMRELVSYVNLCMGISRKTKIKVPFFIGLLIGLFFDLIAKISSKKFAISAIRVRKFCSNSVYSSAISTADFTPPVPLLDGIRRTIYYEFVKNEK